MTNRSGERPGGQGWISVRSVSRRKGDRRGDLRPNRWAGLADDRGHLCPNHSLVDWGGDRPPLTFGRGQPASRSGPITKRSSEKIATAFLRTSRRHSAKRECAFSAHATARDRASSNYFQPARTLSAIA